MKDISVGGCCQATHEEVCNQALEHYEEISSRACNWSSVVPKAIKYYRDNYKEDGDMGSVSDGYHTFDELYEHRIVLYIALCRWMINSGHHPYIWRSKIHSNGTSFDGWFILGIGGKVGKQISYHLPMSKWDETSFADTLDKEPEYDGHTTEDVLNRLKML